MAECGRAAVRVGSLDIGAGLFRHASTTDANGICVMMSC
jgi:hypothetical protein